MDSASAMLADWCLRRARSIKMKYYRRAARSAASTAAPLVQHQVEDRTWTARWKATVESRTTAEAAAEMGITPNAVRLAKSHEFRGLREEMGDLIA
jgi:hypothetical protein